MFDVYKIQNGKMPFYELLLENTAKRSNYSLPIMHMRLMSVRKERGT